MATVHFRESIDGSVFVHEADCKVFMVDRNAQWVRFSRDGRVYLTVPFANVRWIREVL